MALKFCTAQKVANEILFYIFSKMSSVYATRAGLERKRASVPAACSVFFLWTSG